MARNLPHDALTRVLCNLSGDLNLVEMALGTCSHWHRLGKDGALWKALGYARWGGGEGRMFKGINFWPIEIARDCFVERATGKVLRSAEVESLSVGGLLGERRPFRRVGQIQMHSSGLALTSMGGKVMLLNFNKMAHCLASFVVNLVCDLGAPGGGSFDISRWDTDGSILAIVYSGSRDTILLYRIPLLPARIDFFHEDHDHDPPKLSPVNFHHLTSGVCQSISVGFNTVAVSTHHLKTTRVEAFHPPPVAGGSPGARALERHYLDQFSKTTSKANALCCLPSSIVTGFSKGWIQQVETQANVWPVSLLALKRSWARKACLGKRQARKANWTEIGDWSVHKLSRHPTTGAFLMLGTRRGSSALQCTVVHLGGGIRATVEINSGEASGPRSQLLDACWHEECVASVYKNGTVRMHDPRGGGSGVTIYRTLRYPITAATLCSLTGLPSSLASVMTEGGADQVRIHHLPSP